MCRIRRAVGIDSVVRISVVCSEKHSIVLSHSGFHNPLHTLVNLRHRTADGCKYARMAHHISVGEIEDNHILLSLVDCLHKLVSHLHGTHFRQQVVGRNLRRIHQDAVLILKLRLPSSVEEESHVGIFFGLRNAKLPLSGLCNRLSERVKHIFLREEDVDSGE